MEKKVIFLDEPQIKANLNNLDTFKTKMNRVYEILKVFGIDEPAAAKAPLVSVNEKLKHIIPHDEKFDVDAEKVADMIGKSDLYQELKTLNKEIVRNSLLDKVRWNKNSFSFKANVEKDIKEEASVVLTDPDQIALHDRLEAFIKESEELSRKMGERYNVNVMVRFLNCFRIKGGQISVNHHVFMRQIKQLETVEKSQSSEPTPKRITGLEKALLEAEVEALEKLAKLTEELEEKKVTNDFTGIKKIEETILNLNGSLRDIDHRMKFMGLRPKEKKK